MKHKLATWLRIQRRMALIYLAEIYVMFERPLMIFVNFLIFLTLPLWVGFAYMAMIVSRARSKKSVERKVLSGEIWWWDQYKLY